MPLSLFIQVYKVAVSLCLTDAQRLISLIGRETSKGDVMLYVGITRSGWYVAVGILV